MTKVEAVSPKTLKDIFQVAPKNGEADETPPPPARENLMPKDSKVDPTVLWDGLLTQIPSLLEDLEVPTIIAEAWSKAKQLEEYHDRTLHPAGELSAVSMVEHTISAGYQPTIEVVIGGTQVDSVAVDINVQFVLEALVLEIQNARVMAVRPGQFTASGSVTCRGMEVKKLESHPFELKGRQALGEGVEIPSLGKDHNEAEPGRKVAPPG